MPCFSGIVASPKSSLMLLRTKVTVTVTKAPAVTTLVFSSSMTANKKEYQLEIKFQKHVLNIPSHLIEKSIKGIFPSTFKTLEYSSSDKFLSN